jgi:DNA ligase-1
MIPSGFRPMLAVNMDKVKSQPNQRVMSEKLNGCRCLVFGGVAYSRSLKPLPNRKLQEFCKANAAMLEGADGEVLSGDRYDKDILNKSVSFCMSEDNTANFMYYIFDVYLPDYPTASWYNRNHLFSESIINAKLINATWLQHYPVESDEALMHFEKILLDKGAEGVMVRDVNAAYKCNRSGVREPELQKVKRFTDDEFKVVGYEQFETNQNELQRDERGYAKRSTSKDGKQLVEALGSLVCALADGRTFNVGSGFTESQRFSLWQIRDSLVGRLAKVKFFQYSPDGIPLLPVFLDFRHSIDL